MMILCVCFLKPDLLEVHLVFRNEALVTSYGSITHLSLICLKCYHMVLKQVIT